MDKIFKIGLLVLGFGFLAYMYCPHTDQVGRYRMTESGSTITFFDTSNADLYICTMAGGTVKGLKVNPITGKNITIED
jgi:hypothetical protein